MKTVDIDREEAPQWRRAEVFAFLFGAGVYAIELSCCRGRCVSIAGRLAEESRRVLGGIARVYQHA